MLGMSFSANAIDFDTLNWKESLVKDNLKIEVAKVEGFDIKAFKAKSTYNASMEQMLAAITDMTRFTQWVEGALEARVIKKIDNHTQACYYVNEIPWPLKDRDGVIVQRVNRVDEKTIRIDLSTMNELAPENGNYVRISQLEGAWVLKKIDENKVELTYLMHLDPVGNIPTSIVNLMLTDTPKKTLMNLHKVNLGHYDNVVAGLAAE